MPPYATAMVVLCKKKYKRHVITMKWNKKCKKVNSGGIATHCRFRLSFGQFVGKRRHTLCVEVQICLVYDSYIITY